MTSHQFHVITLSETWLDETVSDTEVLLPGYTIIRNDRNRHGGGVAILINNSIRCTPRPDLQLNSVETIWIELFPNSKRSLLICCAYRPPTQSDFFENLSSEYDLALSTSPSLPNAKLLHSFSRQLNLSCSWSSV